MIIRAYAVPHPPIILPEIGRGKKRKSKDDAFFPPMAEEIEALSPDTIVLSSPHAPFTRTRFSSRAAKKWKAICAPLALLM